MRVTKEVTFDMAHRLSDYEGQCRSIHGHTYKLQATIEGELTKGMVVDFAVLKNSLRTIADAFDHAIVLKRDSVINKQLIALCKEYDLKCVVVEYQPTAENMAQEIFDKLLKDWDVVSVKLWETPTSFAEATSESRYTSFHHICEEGL